MRSRKNKFTGTWLCTTRDSGVRFLTYVDVTLLLLVRSVVESAGSSINEVWLEQYFRAVETFSANSGDVSVWENVGLALACDASLGTRCFGGDEVNLTGSRGSSFLIEWASRLQGPQSTNSTE